MGIGMWIVDSKHSKHVKNLLNIWESEFSSLIYLLKMVIVHSYIPEGKWFMIGIRNSQVNPTVVC